MSLSLSSDGKTICPDCKGTGRERINTTFWRVITSECWTCLGTGAVSKAPVSFDDWKAKAR